MGLQEVAMSTIPGVEVTRPHPGTLRISKRGQARASLIAGALFTIAFAAWPLLLVHSSDKDGAKASDFVCFLGLFLVPGLIVFPMFYWDQIRMLVQRESFAFTRGTATIEHAGRPAARFAVAGIQVNTANPETGAVFHTHTLFIVPQNSERLRICRVEDDHKAEMLDLAQELAGILGVEVTLMNT
jgi:hypothetical protein